MLENNLTETQPPASSAAQSTVEVVDPPVQQSQMSYFNSILPQCMAEEIFNLVKEDQDEIHFCSTPIPFRLGSVCRSWRNTISMDTRMWDTIAIQLSQRKFDVQLELLREWLRRSGSRCPLYCYIQVKDNHLFQPPSSFADLIMEVSGRLKVFECVSSVPALSGKLQAQAHDFSLLSKMKIFNPMGFRLNFSSATQLRDLVITDTGVVCAVNNHTVNWAILTNLQINDDVLITHAIHMVQNLVNIEHLSLCFADIYLEPNGQNQVPRTLPRLSRLTLGAKDSSATSFFIKAITTPVLHNLRLTFAVDIDPCYRMTMGDWDPTGLSQVLPPFFYRSRLLLEDCTVLYPKYWQKQTTAVMRYIAASAYLSVYEVDSGYWVKAVMSREY